MTGTVLFRLDELADGEVRQARVGRHVLAVVRIGERAYALGDRCTHQDVSLSDGEVDPDECTLECPKHGAAFRLDTGEATCLPATRPVPTYEVSVVDGNVTVVIP